MRGNPDDRQGETINKNLIRVGGLLNLLFVVFQLAMVKPLGQALAPLAPDSRAIVSTLNISVAFILLVFAYLDIFRWRDLLTTRLGNIVAIAISLFWFARAASQVVFYGLTTAGLPLLGLCLVFGLLHLVPVLREWKKVSAGAQHPSEVRLQVEAPASQEHEPQERVHEQSGKAHWPGYAAIAWCLLFGGLHLYWALGGAVGFAAWSTPPNKMLALTRDPGYMAMTLAVAMVCAFGAMVALAAIQRWGRRIPRWLLLTPLWVACGLCLLRGIGNPIQAALVMGGGMPQTPLTGLEAQAWAQWMRLDCAVFSPWFILGGLAFGATARLVSRRGADKRGPRVGAATLSKAG